MRKPSEKEELEGERRLGRGEDQQRRLLKKERRRRVHFVETVWRWYNAKSRWGKRAREREKGRERKGRGGEGDLIQISDRGRHLTMGSAPERRA